MRCSNIQIHARIPIPVNSDGTGVAVVPSFRDLNGVVYAIDAVKNACGDADTVPIIRYRDDGEPEPVGVARSVQWDPQGFIEIDGVLFVGGTAEDVIVTSSGDVVSMDIESIGLGIL